MRASVAVVATLCTAIMLAVLVPGQASAAVARPSVSPAALPNLIVTFRAESVGGPDGYARFLRNSLPFFDRGGGALGGRGFNLAVADPLTGAIINPGTNYDTWLSSNQPGRGGPEMFKFLDDLQAIPNGRLVLLAVGDEAGLNPGNSCARLTYPWVTRAYEVLESLGSQQIRNYCYRFSWAMIFIKGQPLPIGEQVAPEGQVAAANATFTVNPCSPRPAVTQAVAPGGGRLNVTVRPGNPGDFNVNRLLHLDFRSATNALITIGGQTRRAPFVVDLAPGVESISFTVQRETANVTTHLSFIVTDECGTWPTFVGGGPRAPF
jgi:hypothetical protein